MDECSNCFGDGFTPDCVGNDSCLDMDCIGDCQGIAFLDDCGTCSEGDTGHTANSEVDECGICFGDGFGEECVGNESCSNMDCYGICSGTALLDDCDVCSGGESGHTSNSDIDCNGDCFGAAEIDECDFCTGGNTNIIAGELTDCSGECFQIIVDGDELVYAWESENCVKLMFLNDAAVLISEIDFETEDKYWINTPFNNIATAEYYLNYIYISALNPSFYFTQNNIFILSKIVSHKIII